MLELFRVAAKLVLDKAGFDKDISDADKSGKGLADNLSGYMEKAKKVLAGIASAAVIKKAASAVWDLAKETAAAGDRIDKTSQSLGLSRKAFQEWDYILSQNGASIDNLGMTMKTLQEAISSNSGEVAAGLSKLGLSAAQLQSMSPEDQFEAIVKALQKMPAGAQKSQLAMTLLGRNAQSLMPLLNSSADSVEELRQRAHDLGLIMSDNDVDASVAFGDALDDLTKTFDHIKYGIGAKVLPVLTTGMTNITNYAGKIKRAYDEKGLSGVFETLVNDVRNIKWPSWEDVKTALTKAWDTIVKGAEGLAKVVFGENVDGTIHWPTWEEIGEAVGKAWKGIVDGVSNLGNTIGKAVFGENADGTIHWPTWEEIVSAVQTAWQGIVDGVSGLGTGIGRVVFGENVDGTIKWPTWEDISKSVSDAWQGIIDGVKDLGNTIGKVVFGENVDGSIKWPQWSDVSKAATAAWKGIKDGLANLAVTAGKWVFGANDESSLSWLETIKSWLDGTGLSDITLNFTGKIFGWVKTIYDWVTKGVNVMVSFLSNGLDSTQPTFSVGDQTFSDPMGVFGNGGINSFPAGGIVPHAKGLNYVPYDGYRAVLHRGETILNQAQGREWRQNNGDSGLNMRELYDAVSGAVAEAVSQIQFNIDGKKVANAVTNQVSQNMYQAQRGRRFASA